MLELQKFLKSRNSMQALHDAKEILKLTVYDVDPDLVVFNYNMIDTPRGIPESEEARGLVLEKNTWNVVAFPFYRFYNIGEHYAQKLNTKRSVLFEKRDGSLMTMYYYDGWRVATRGRPLAEGLVNNTDKKFSELFWETLEGKYGNKWERMENRNLNFVFEFTGPYNRIVTPYQDNDLRLLTVRHIDNYAKQYKEFDLSQLQSISEAIGVPLPKMYNASTDEIRNEKLEELNTLDEGFVMVDYSQRINDSFARIKIKNPRYLLAHDMIGNGFNKIKAMSLMLEGEMDEFISYFPEYREEANEYELQLCKYLTEVHKYYNSIKSLANKSRKDFALEATKKSYANVLFAMLDKKDEDGMLVSDIVRSMSPKTKENFLEKIGGDE